MYCINILKQEGASAKKREHDQEIVTTNHTLQTNPRHHEEEPHVSIIF